jgi:hypothetical protein
VTPARGLRQRRQELERRLRAAGLKRASLSQVPRWLDPQTQARVKALRAELEALGPLFRCLGRYLSSRVDHLSGVDCRALATLPDRAEPMPPAAVLALLRSELGAAGSALFARLDAAPIESLVWSQSHRGWLSDGRAVCSKLSRTSVVSDPDLAVLPHLAGYLSSLGLPLPAARRLLDDFKAVLERRLDRHREAQALDALHRSSSPERFGAPRVLHELSTPRILTFEVPWGVPHLGEGVGARTTAEATALARDLADLWMQFVFGELRIPEELEASDVLKTRQGTLVLTGGLFEPVPRAAADALWRYVVAAASDDTDDVFEAMRALSTETDRARPDALRQQMGHVVPRRDGRFGEAPPGLPELLLSHWLQAERHGLVPGPPLLAFHRGLVSLRELAGVPLSASVFREALQVSQIGRGAERLRSGVADSELLTRGTEGLAQILTNMPRLLERASAHPRPARHRVREREDDAWSGEWMLLAAWLLMAATLWLWFQRLPMLLGSWTETALAGILTLVGLGLVRRIWRSR